MQIHETSLKEGNKTPFSCNKCDAPLVVKKNNSTGEAFLGCSLYRETNCKGGYPLKREHITPILKYNNMEGKIPTNEKPKSSTIKTPESSLPYDPPPPIDLFGGSGFTNPDEGQEITINLNVKLDAVQLNSIFALIEKLSG